MVFQRNVSDTGSMRRISGCVLAALVWVAAPGTAWAQQSPGDVAQARELFVQASELRDQGDAKGALEKFKAAHALAVNPITTFELARTYAALGMLAEAREAYASIASLPVQPDETERATLARRDAAKALDELKAQAPAPTVKVAAPQDTPTVAPTPSGSHEPATGVALQLPASSPADATRQAPDASGNHFGPLAYAGFGVGAAGFLVGTILAAATLSTASSISCSTTSCAQSSVDAAHSARDLGVAAVISYTIGGLGVAVGVTDLLVYKRGPTPPATGLTVHPWIGAGAAGLHGSF
jgi:hypothetical protein